MAESIQKVAIITGSGRKRVGNVVAKSLGQSGYAVALHYNQSAESAAQNVDDLRSAGVTAEKFRADVGSQTQVDEMFDSIEAEFGRLDVLVTTASVWESIPLDDVTADDILRNFHVNTLGTFLCARRAGLKMASQESGGWCAHYQRSRSLQRHCR